MKLYSIFKIGYIMANPIFKTGCFIVNPIFISSSYFLSTFINNRRWVQQLHHYFSPRPQSEKTTLEYELDNASVSRARIGILLLSSDQVFESEYRSLPIIDGIEFYISRINCCNIISLSTLNTTLEFVRSTSQYLLPGIPLDIIIYGCTSGSAVIGEHKVNEAIQQGRPEVNAGSTIQALKCALTTLNKIKIGIIVPYCNEVTMIIKNSFQEYGITVCTIRSFEVTDDNQVACISKQSIIRAVIDIGNLEDVQCVVLCCTNLRSLSFIENMEQTIGKPIISSTQATIWYALRKANIIDKIEGYGCLFRN